MLWAQVATANEEDLPRDAHRDRSPCRAQYLQHLQSLGYVLSDVEQMILDNAADERPTETSHGDQTDDAAAEQNSEVTAD